ncbi:hypothetical protein IJT93_10770 [bacterium]|nr:hypothetical protein [bacterium]
MLDFFRKNIGLKILSLTLAVLTFILVKSLASPIKEFPIQRIFTKSIDVIAPKNENYIYSVATKEVNITVKGKKSVINRLEPSLITAIVDLSERTHQGSTLEKVDVMAPGGAEIVQIEPSHVWTAVSKKSTSVMPVKVQLLGNVNSNFQVGKAVVEPPSVRLIGSEDSLSKVAKVLAEVAVAGIDETLSTQVRSLKAVDSDNNTVDGIEFSNECVSVTVPVFPVREAEVSLMKVSVKGGGDSYKLICYPDKVTLRGESPEDLNISEVFVEPYQFEKNRQVQTKALKLEIPDNVKILDLPQNYVTVTAEPITECPLPGKEKPAASPKKP